MFAFFVYIRKPLGCVRGPFSYVLESSCALSYASLGLRAFPTSRYYVVLRTVIFPGGGERSFENAME